jgi:LysM repeat protein
MELKSKKSAVMVVIEMDIDDLHRIIKARIEVEEEKKYIKLEKLATDLSSKGQEAAAQLLRYLGGGDLRIQIDDHKEPENGVEITGKAEFFNIQQSITLIGQIDSQDNVFFRLDGSPLSEWSFAKGFPGLNTLDYLSTDPEEIFLSLKKSFFEEFITKNPKFIVSTCEDKVNDLRECLNFVSNLDMTEGPLSTIKDLLGKKIPNLQDMLPLKGTIEFGDTNVTFGDEKEVIPKICLTADIPDLKLGKISFEDMKLKLQTAIDDMKLSIEITGNIKIGDKIKVPLAAPMLQGNNVWTFSSKDLEEKLVGGLQELADLVSGSIDDFALPEQIKKLANFDLHGLSIGVNPCDFSVDFVKIAVSIPDEWNIGIKNLVVGGIEAEWTFYFSRLGQSEEKPLVEGHISGTIEYKVNDKLIKLIIEAEAPDFTIKAKLNLPDSKEIIPDSKKINFNDVLEHFIGSGVKYLSKMIINRFDLTIPEKNQYSTYIETDCSLEILSLDILKVTLEGLNLLINYDASLLSGEGLSGKVTAQFKIAVEEVEILFFVSAEKPESSEDWIFSLSMADGQKVDLGSIINKFIPTELPGFLKDIEVTDMLIPIDKVSGKYSFQTQFLWDLVKTLDIPIKINGAIKLAYEGNGLSGYVQGIFIWRNLNLTVRYTFSPNDENTFIFSIKFKDQELNAKLIKEEVEGQAKKLLKFQLPPGLTLGDVIEYLLGLAVPGRQVKLQSPWDALTKIDLKDIFLKVDLKGEKVSIGYEKKIDLKFVRIDSIELVYERKGSVDIKIVGNFLDQEYTEEKPLKWDIVNDSPPSVPGKGSKLLDLRYIGLGQHVSLANTGELTDIKKVITALEEYMLPVPDSNTNPLGPGSPITGLKFDSASDILFGLDLTVMKAVSLSAIFNDPNMYGLLVTLAGENAGSFSGLRFELLYKKVTNDIGVFKTELRLPDRLRQLDFGGVSITIPVIKVDIYTNGNFKIDLGFPYNLDFSDSFCIQILPFIGFGGFYYSQLTGATSLTVPKITNGEFDPVIEAGIGLSVGFGKTFQEGPLSGGVYIVVVGIVEGTLAWFNPYDEGIGKALYYRVEGIIGICGKLYGCVDFSVIKVEVCVEAKAVVCFIIESHKPIVVALRLQVSVSAKVKVLFVKIRFSFELTMDMSFTIGEESTPPWKLESAAPSSTDMEQMRIPKSFVTGYLGKPLAETVFLDWAPVSIFNSKKQVDMRLLPAFTVKLGSDPKVYISLMLLVDNSIDPGAFGYKDILRATADHCSTAAAVSEVPFNLLVQGVLGWSIHALLGKNKENDINTEELKTLHDQLNSADTRNNGFSYNNLVNFLEMNYDFRISGIPDKVKEASDTSGTVFPMIPELSYRRDSLTIDFKTYNKVNQDYLEEISAYFKQLMVDYEETVARDPFQQEQKFFKQSEGIGGESIATIVFRDYFLMLAKSAAQAAIDLLKSFSYEIVNDESLSTIAGKFHVTPASIAVANQTVPLKTGVTIEISGIKYEIKAGDTLGGIASHFELSDSLNSLIQCNKKNPLLQQGADLTTGPFEYTVLPGDTLDFIAAFLCARTGDYCADETFYSDLAWYEQAIINLNSAVNFDELSSGQNIYVPCEFLVSAQERALSYKTRERDTLELIALYYLFQQTRTSALEDLKEKIRSWNKINLTNIKSGTQLKIGTLTYKVRPGDTFSSIADLFNVTAEDLARANSGADKVLLPLSVLYIPPVSHTTSEGDTLASIAASYNMTVENLGQKVENVSNIFGDSTIKLPLGKLKIKDLLDEIARQGLSNRIAAMISRFLVNGLRLPDPNDSTFKTMSVDELLVPNGKTLKLESLYSLTGQQFPAPTNGIESHKITIINQGASWITFAKTAVVTKSDTGKRLKSAYPGIVAQNLAFDFEKPVPGKILSIEPKDELEIDFSSISSEDYPSTEFDPKILILYGPQPLRLYSLLPMRYSLQKNIHWHASEPLQYAAGGNIPKTGEPILWLFTDSLVNKIRKVDTRKVKFKLFSMPNNGANAEPVPATFYRWATAVELKVKRIRTAGDTVLPYTYELLGADENNRKQLLKIWTYLKSNPADMKLYLLYSSEGGNSGGLSSDALDEDRTFIVKTNLTTLTTSGVKLIRTYALEAEELPTAADLYSATISAKDFVKLLWEASVTGTGGYYLDYRMTTKNGRTALPDRIFSETDVGTLNLLVILSPQNSSDNLLPFNNCVVVGDNIDPSSASVFVQIRNEIDQIKVPAVLPGNVGFELIRYNPEDECTPSQEEKKKQKTRILYHLLGYRIVESGFTGSVQGSADVREEVEP